MTHRDPADWRHLALWRGGFAVVYLATVAAAVLAFAAVLGTAGLSSLEILLLVLYALLVAWIGANFWAAMIGAAHLVRRRRAMEPSAGVAGQEPGDSSSWRTPRIAAVVPVYNEAVHRVFDRVSAMYDSLRATGCLDAFHVYVLSDTRDPATWLAEEVEWARRCRELRAEGRLFYRHRTYNEGRKSGNVAEFCERWGHHYEYMVVLDADSLMSGPTLVEMVRRMDGNPRLGLLQAWPRQVNGETLYSRIHQFAAVVYGRLIAAGMSVLLGPQGNYWGHNAIIRVRAFMESCGLPKLPGRAPLGGEILSHDFVEAALLVRAGWHVQVATDLPCSYEEGPPNVIANLARERRWCQGNLQHARILPARGLSPASRMNLVTGIMAYAAAPLWLLFLAVAVTTGAQQGYSTSTAFGTLFDPTLNPRYGMPVYGLLGLTVVLLIGPKLLGLAVALTERGPRARLGGAWRLTGGVLLETLFSSLLTPLVMIQHSRFVIAIVCGRDTRWEAQQRDPERVTFSEAFAAHGEETLIAVIGLAVAAKFAPLLLIWLSPVIACLLLSVPLSSWTSSVAAGQASRKLGLFLIPEETEPPEILDRLTKASRKIARHESMGPETVAAADHLVADPFANALHIALLPAGSSGPTGNPTPWFDADALHQHHAAAWATGGRPIEGGNE